MQNPTPLAFVTASVLFALAMATELVNRYTTGMVASHRLSALAASLILSALVALALALSIEQRRIRPL